MQQIHNLTLVVDYSTTNDLFITHCLDYDIIGYGYKIFSSIEDVIDCCYLYLKNENLIQKKAPKEFFDNLKNLKELSSQEFNNDNLKLICKIFA